MGKCARLRALAGWHDVSQATFGPSIRGARKVAMDIPNPDQSNG